MNFLKTIEELRKGKKRNFNQTLDLIITLKDFDPKHETVSTSIEIPYISKRKKICAFLEKPSKIVDYVITKNDIDIISSKEIKNFAKNYDFFISNAKLMPKIASKFGKILGIMGKMPDPKMGCIIIDEKEDVIKRLIEKLSKTIKIRTKEASIKVPIGKEEMSDTELVENASIIVKSIIQALPKKELNVKSILLKFTMTKPIKVEIK